MRFVCLAAAMALAGCDRPAPITLPREEPKPEKESFSGFQVHGTPLPLTDPSVADQPSPTPSPTIAPQAQAAMEDYAKAMRDMRADPALAPPDNLDLIQNPGGLQGLNNAVIAHLRAIQDAQGRAHAAMNLEQRKAWAAKKKEIDEGE